MTDARRRAPSYPPAAYPGLEWRLLATLGLWLVIYGISSWAIQPPRALALDAAEAEFSGERAHGLAEELLGGLGPHPTGSAAAQTLRGRLVEQLEGLGLEPVVRRHVVAPDGRWGVGGVVHNVLARVHGSGSEPAMLLMAHYDSVAAGPGAGDDLAGVVAVLEGVRAHLESGSVERDLVILFTEGEEDGLVGARAFCAQDPWFELVGIAVNLEARGASGPSRLFQTGPNSRELVERYGSEASRPSVDSVSAEVYRRMPNDTDLSPLIAAGIPGVNFAFLSDRSAYHTPNDSLERLSKHSVQHHGENLMAMLRAGELGPLDPEPAMEGAYGDILGRFTWSLGRGSLRVISLVLLLGLASGVARRVRSGELGARGVVLGMLAVPMVLAAAGLFAWGTHAIAVSMARGPEPWWSHGAAGRMALWGAAGLGLGLVAGLFRFRDGARSLGSGIVVLWALVAFFLSLFLPALTHLFLGCVFCAALAQLVPGAPLDPVERFSRLALFCLFGSALIWSPLQMGLDDAFGPDAALITVLPMALIGTWLLPQLAAARASFWRGWMSVAALLAMGGVFMGAIGGQRTVQEPGHLNLVYVLDERAQTAYLEAQCRAEIPAGLEQVGGFVAGEDGVMRSQAPRIDLYSPRFELEEFERDSLGQLHKLRGQLVPGVAGAVMGLQVSGAELKHMRLDGQSLGQRSLVNLVGLPAEGLPLELEFAESNGEPNKLKLQVFLRASGLPGRFRDVLQARPREWVPVGRGDHSLIYPSPLVFDELGLPGTPESETPVEER
ncbi:MAG: hypothetical protein ACI8QC_002892 [Planctomycetota bacterium]|jgi:hypothetical protein